MLYIEREREQSVGEHPCVPEPGPVEVVRVNIVGPPATKQFLPIGFNLTALSSLV